MSKQTKTPVFFRRVSLLAILAVVLVSGFVAIFNRNEHAAALTSSTINFQARLLTISGNLVPDGQYNVEFKIYNALTSSGSPQGSCTGDAACQWVETRTTSDKVRVVNGYMTVNLGSVNGFGNINWDQDMYLSMNVGGTGTASWDGEMTPRLKLTAVPYAFRAGTLIGGTGANTTTLTTGTPSGNHVIQLPAEDGTVCLQASVNCGFLTGTAANYIQNQNVSQQATSNFWISGTGRMDTGLQAPLLDTATGVALNIGTTNATVINLNQNTTIAATKTLTVTSGATSLTGATTGDALTVSNSTSTGNIAVFKDNTAAVMTIADGGGVTFTNTVDSSAALSVTNSLGGNVVSIDTSGSGASLTLGRSGAPGYIGNVVSGTYQTSSVTTRPFTFSAGVATGNTVVGAMSLGTTSVDAGLTVTDTAGNSYTIDASISSGSTTSYIFSSRITNAITAGDTLTVANASSTARWAIHADVFGNILNPRIDRTATNTATSISPVSGTTAATTTANELVFGTFGFIGGHTFNAGGGYTALSQLMTTVGSTDRGVASEYKYVTSTGTQTATGSFDSSSIYSGAVVTYKSNNALSGGQAGSIKFSGGDSSSNYVQLGTSTLTTTRNIQLPDESGTICLRSSASCGFTTSTQVIQNQNAVQQASSNFWISGTGRADTGFQAPSLDTAVAGTLTIGGTNASSVTLDTGPGTGTVVANKTFESTTESMSSWFNINVARSSTQARTGTWSLAGTATGGNWGIQEDYPGTTSVTPGHQYSFSLWMRANTTVRTITGTGNWVGGAGTVSMGSAADTNTGWTQLTGVGTAPAGATSVYFTITTGAGSAGEIHYFDDLVITDLTANVSNVNIGTTNATTITIGNSSHNSALVLDSGTGSISIGTGAQARTTNIATGAAIQTVTIGSTNSTSSLALQSGTGAISIGTTNQARTINIGTGNATQAVTVGSTSTSSTGVLQGGAGSVTVNNTSIALNKATTITGNFIQSGGTFSATATGTGSLTSTTGLTLTGGAASTWSTSAGALTLTSAAAATWSTAAGGLTIQANGTSTLLLQTSGAGTVDVGGSNATTLTLGASATTITMGSSNTARSISIGAGGTSTTQTILVGSFGGSSITTLQSGSGNTFLKSRGSTIVRQDTTATTTAFQVQNVAGTSTFLNVDASGGLVGINTTAANERLTVNGNFNVRDADSPTKALRWRTNGASIDFETGGAGTVGDLYISGWTGPNMLAGTDTQVNWFRMSSSTRTVSVGAASATTTPTLLVLDRKSDAGDPGNGTDGAMYYNDVSDSFRCYKNGGWVGCMSGMVFANTTPATAITAASETNFNQNYTIPASECKAGQAYRVTAQGVFTAATTTTMIFKLKLGSTTLVTSKGSPSGGSTDLGWRLEGQFICNAAPSGSSAVEGQAMVLWSTSQAANGIGGSDMAATATTNVATNAAQTLQISMTWGGTGRSITMRQFIVEKLE